MTLSIVLAGMLLAAPALAGPRQDKAARQAEVLAGEVRRLEAEIEGLAGDSHFDGVERAYQEIVDAGGLPSRRTHLLAAQAARQQGDLLQVSLRLRRAAELESDSNLVEELRRLDEDYGRVVVRVQGDAVLPPLATEVSTFNPDPRRAVEYARAQLIERRMFRGLLPVGEYQLGETRFNVVPGTAWSNVVVQASADEG